MPSVKVITTIDCDVSTSEEAHQLGAELENRIYLAIEALLPNLRYGSVIKNGTVSFDISLQGRRAKLKHKDSVQTLNKGQ